MSDGAVHAMEAAVECNDLPSPPPQNSVNGQVETPSRSSKGEAKALSPPVTDAFADEDVDTGIGRRTRSKVRKEVDPKPKDDSVDDEVHGKTECTDGKSKVSLTARLVREQPESVTPEESQSSYRHKKENESIDSAAQSNGEVQTIRKVSKTESTSTGEGQGKASQTIIVTETRSLAKVINEAVRKDSAGQSDGKPTLVIIETKSGSGGQSAGLSSGIMAKSSSNYQLPNILRTSGGSQLKSGLTVQPMQPRSTLSTFFPMSTSSTLALQSRQVRTTAPSFMSPAQLIAPYRQHQLTPSSLNSNSASLAGSLSFPITTQLPPAFVTSDLLENQVDLKTNNGDILIDIPSLVVPYLIEYPTRERLSIFIKELLAAEEKTKLEEARKEREKEMNDDKDVIDCDKEKSSKPDGDKNEDVPSVVVVAEKVVTTAASEQIPPEKKTFFDTTLGSFFVDIGLNLVQEWVQVELLRSQRKKLDKGWKTTDRERMVRSLTRSLEDYRQKNKVFRHPLKRCPMPGCAFKTESQIVMDHHLEVLHLHDGKYLCTYCPAQTVEPTEILRHVYERHKVFGRLEKKLLSHTCHQCPFEDTSKARLTRHLWKCQKTFAGEKNLSPPPDFEPPAKRVRLVAPISTLSMSLSTTPTTSSSNKMSLSIPTGAQGRPTVQTPIRPKVTDLKAFTPFGSLKSTTSTAAFLPANLKTPTFLTGATSSANVLARSGTASAARLSAGGTLSHSPVLVPGSIHSAGYQIQQGQLYQVVNTTGGVVPMVGNPYNPQGFTILPTTATSMNTRGPTPVALIPNVARSMISTPSSVQRSPSPRVSSPLWRPPAPTLSAHSYRSTLSSLPMSSLSKLPAKPNISITPVTRTPSLPSVTVTSSTKTLPSATLTKTSTSPRVSDASPVPVSQSAGPGKPRFVVCEICDGYIKDLDQLRIHMQWIHKIKIHPKMIHNRPPLNCQKCQFRFFTDQGLERHLLGTHGLVTSSMQDSANKGKDGGRCTVCGRVFVWKLLVHMAKDHKMVLKPAHLSYKCTVCSATFNMYRLFENHVYEAHSTVAKRVLDKPGRGGSGVGISGLKAEDAPVTLIKSRGNAPSSVASSSSVTGTPSRASRGGSSSGSSRNPDEEDREVKTKCVECGIYFFQSGTCIHHWKKTHLRPCKVKLCRVDKCAKCRGRVDRPRRSCRSKPARISDCGDNADFDSPLEEEQDDLPDIPPVEAAAPPPPLDGGIEDNVLEIDDDDDDDDYDDDAEVIEEDPMSRSSWNAEVGGSQSVKKIIGEEVSSGKNTNATTPRNTVIVIDQGGSENNDDTPFDMEVESHDHSELEEEVHTDVEED